MARPAGRVRFQPDPVPGGCAAGVPGEGWRGLAHCRQQHRVHSVRARQEKLMTPAQTRHLLKPRGLPKRLSLVLAIYNEEEALPFLRKRLTSFADGLPYQTEIILVNDGSSDGSLGLLMEWSQADSRVKLFNLARNFGHQAAATAGLD